MIESSQDPKMPPAFPDMDPFLKKGPIFCEMHTQMIAFAQGLLQPQLRPTYIAKLERPGLDADEDNLRKQRRVVIYANAKPRRAFAAVALLTLWIKDAETSEPPNLRTSFYLQMRSSALEGEMNWVEIDLLRGGQRPPLNVQLTREVEYLAYVAQATPTGWNHQVYGWGLRDPMPPVPIPLLGNDRASLDLVACFRVAYDGTAADDEAEYASDPPPPLLRPQDREWVDEVLRQNGIRA